MGLQQQLPQQSKTKKNTLQLEISRAEKSGRITREVLTVAPTGTQHKEIRMSPSILTKQSTGIFVDYHHKCVSGQEQFSALQSRPLGQSGLRSSSTGMQRF